MITTGIIRQINLSSGNHKNNKYKVELNLFQIPGDRNKDSYTFDANCMVASGFSAVYNVGDKVFVGFLNNDKSFPIILGKIYQGVTDDYRGYGALTDLKVKNSVELPSDLTIGSYNYNDLDLSFKKLSLLSIQQVNQLVTLLASTPLTAEHLKQINDAANAMANIIKEQYEELNQSITDKSVELNANIAALSNSVSEQTNKINADITEIEANLARLSDTDIATLHNILNFRGRFSSLADITNPANGDLIILTTEGNAKYIYVKDDEEESVGEWLQISGLGAAIADINAELLVIENDISSLQGSDSDTLNSISIVGAKKYADSLNGAMDVRVGALETTVGDSTKGLVKNVAANATAIATEKARAEDAEDQIRKDFNNKIGSKTDATTADTIYGAIADAKKAGTEAAAATAALKADFNSFNNGTAKSVSDIEKNIADLEDLISNIEDGALSDVAASLNNKVNSVEAADKSINITGETTKPVLQVNLSKHESNAITLEDDGLQVLIPESPEYSVVKDATASDYAAVYHLTKDGTNIGAAINIPKDMVVASGEVVTNPEGQAAGTYIKIVLQNVAEPLYINVGDLIEYVTSGSAADDAIVVAVSDDHKVTATITNGKITLAKLDTDTQTKINKAHEHANFDDLKEIEKSSIQAWNNNTYLTIELDSAAEAPSISISGKPGVRWADLVEWLYDSSACFLSDKGNLDKSNCSFEIKNGFVVFNNKDKDTTYYIAEIKLDNILYYVKSSDIIQSNVDYKCSKDSISFKINTDSNEYFMPRMGTSTDQIWKVFADYVNNDMVMRKHCEYLDINVNPVSVNIPSDFCCLYNVENFDSSPEQKDLQWYDTIIADGGRYKLGVIPSCIKNYGKHSEGEVEIENLINATCEEDGSCDNVVYCSSCRKELSRVTNVIKATGHNYIDGKCECGQTQPENPTIDDTN